MLAGFHGFFSVARAGRTVGCPECESGEVAPVSGAGALRVIISVAGAGTLRVIILEAKGRKGWQNLSSSTSQIAR